MARMIEIKKNENSNRDSAYLLFIDGKLLENAYVYIHPREQDSCEITVKDEGSSRIISKYRLTDFPLFINQMTLGYYPTKLEHFNGQSGVFINHVYTKEGKPTKAYTAYLELGGEALSGWMSPYAFVHYAKKMYQLLKKRDDILDISLNDIQHSWLDKWNDVSGEQPIRVPIGLDEIDERRIHSLSVEFPYSSPDVIISDELDRIFIILQEAHQEAVKLLAPSITRSPLEIRKIGGIEPEEYRLFVNDSLLEEANVKQYGWHLPKGPFWRISIDSPIAYLKLYGSSFYHIPSKVTVIDVLLAGKHFSRSGLIESKEKVRIRTPDVAHGINDIIPSHYSTDYSVTFYFKGSHAIEVYDKVLNELFADSLNVFFGFGDLQEYTFELQFRVSSPGLQIVEEIVASINTVRMFLNAIDDKIKAATSPNSIVYSFNFPPEIAISCEQYLQYFIQFLRDLGVEATSELRHKAGEVLFTVTPVDERDALDKIREAMSIYLELPKSPVSNDMENEIAVQRLEMAVHRLQGELKLAAAEIRANNTTIEAQRLMLDVQKKMLSGEIMTNAVKDITPKPEADEPILGGLITLSTIGKGIKINFAEMFRKLKRQFRKND